MKSFCPKCPFSIWFAWSHTTLFSTQHALDSIAAIYLGRSKGLCSSYLFTVHNTEVYMYLSDRKVSFVNSEMLYVKFSYRKKTLLIHKCSKQLGYLKCLLVPELVKTMSTTRLSLRPSFLAKKIKKQCEFFPLLLTPQKL